MTNCKMDTMGRVNLAIVGAGPAGMAAARQAVDVGLKVVLLDEQPRVGGQIYRNVTRAAYSHGEALGQDYVSGLKLAEAVQHRQITHKSKAAVWSIEPGCVHYRDQSGMGVVNADHVLLATGAIERPMPLKGWTLPGVMTAGAAQIMLKQSAVAPRQAVLVGSGPLLYLVAVQLLRAGCPPSALVETQLGRDKRRAIQYWRGALAGWRYLRQGLDLMIELRNAGIRRFEGAHDLVLLGENRVESVHFRSGGRLREIGCDTVLLHHGVIPNIHATKAAGIGHHWSPRRQAFAPNVDQWGQSDINQLWIAGDNAGITGAVGSALSGSIAALGIAGALGSLTQSERDMRARPLLAKRAKEFKFRSFIERAFPPYKQALLPDDSVPICRCEEVTAGEIRSALAHGQGAGPNQIKAYTRVGMGRCQGRICGTTVSRLIAEAQGTSVGEIEHFKIRPPLRPVTLGALASLHDPEDPLEQVGIHD